MEMVKLPKGVTVEVSRKKYGGDVKIPACICPVKYMTVSPKSSQEEKPDTSQAEKPTTEQAAKPATGKKSGEAEK